MDTALQDRRTRDSSADAPGAPAGQRSRGDLVLSRQVVEKIASQAAVEVAAAGGRSGGFLGIGTQADLSSRPKVSVDLSGRTASISVEVAIAYPNPIARASEEVRRRIMSRVNELAGVETTRVDVTVISLISDRDTREVLR